MLLIKNIDYLDENFKLIKGKSILINPPFIEKIFDSEISEEKKFDIIDGKNKILMPGFVNNHAHNAMTLLRGYAENLPLARWLFEKVFPFENVMNNLSANAGIKIAAAEMLKNGIVSSSDMYFFAEESIKTYLEIGMKINFARAIVSDGDTALNDLISFKEAKEVYEKFNNADDERIKIDFALHAEYTSEEKTVREFSDYVKNLDTGIHLHIAETKKETDECKKRRKGRTPVKYFYDNGLLSKRTLGAHLVWINDEDIEILKETKTFIATCPNSNLKLASGIARLKDMFIKNLNITIGTDSAASNNSLDILSEIKLAYLLQRNFYNDFEILTPKKLLSAAT
ncbi:MAG: amidohydrolase family protein, partial [Clostridiales Family XIII bacterium]|nr:amidohydrolase family protein [Clostridiales Family XIII bacterium]